MTNQVTVNTTTKINPVAVMQQPTITNFTKSVTPKKIKFSKENVTLASNKASRQWVWLFDATAFKCLSDAQEAVRHLNLLISPFKRDFKITAQEIKKTINGKTTPVAYKIITAIKYKVDPKKALPRELINKQVYRSWKNFRSVIKWIFNKIIEKIAKDKQK